MYTVRHNSCVVRFFAYEDRLLSLLLLLSLLPLLSWHHDMMETYVRSFHVSLKGREGLSNRLADWLTD